MARSYDLGAVTAYATAVEHGYSGTEEQFAAEMTGAAQYSRNAEAYAKGTRNEIPVPSSDEAYHNNSKYYAELAQEALENVGRPTEEMTEQKINAWLNEHPEATTTVQDNSLGYSKFTTNAIESLKDTMGVIFMPCLYQLQSGAPGDCTVFITNNNRKTIMIDTGTTRSYSLIKAELVKASVSHIDYFILTHYHGDHYENLSNLINDGYIDSTTVSYLPKSSGVSVSNWGDETGVRSLLSTTQFRTTENETISIDGVEIEFFNSRDEDVAYYDSLPSPDCNNYSVCCYVTYGKTRILMTGDIQAGAEQYLYDNGFIRQCDILKIPHHSYDASASFDFYLACLPSHAIMSGNAYTEQVNSTGSKSIRNGYLFALGSEIYSVGYGAVYVGVAKNVFSVYPNGEEIKAVCLPLTFHINQNYTDRISNGSSRQPFKNMIQAIKHTAHLKCELVTLTFDSDYDGSAESQLKICSPIPKITIDGNSRNVILGPILARNATLELTNLKIDGPNTTMTAFLSLEDRTICNAINIEISKNTHDQESSVSGRGINLTKCSTLYISNSTLSNLNYVFGCSAGSSIRGNNVSGSNNLRFITSSVGASVRLTNSTIEYSTLFKENLSADQVQGAASIVINNFEYNHNGSCVVYKEDANGTQTEYTIDLSSNIYARKMFMLYSSDTSVYLIIRWAGSMRIVPIFVPSSPTILINSDGFKLKVTTVGIITLTILN